MAESILLKNDPTGSGRLLIELLDMTSVITANVQVENNKKGEEKSKNGHQEKMANGITIGTNYRVYAVQKVGKEVFGKSDVKKHIADTNNEWGDSSASSSQIWGLKLLHGVLGTGFQRLCHRLQIDRNK